MAYIRGGVVVVRGVVVWVVPVQIVPVQAVWWCGR